MTYSFFQILKDATSASEYGWSYIVAWVGIGFILISSVMMLIAYRTMKVRFELNFSDLIV